MTYQNLVHSSLTFENHKIVIMSCKLKGSRNINYQGQCIKWKLGNSPGYNTVIALGLALPHWLVDVKMFNNLTPLFQI